MQKSGVDWVGVTGEPGVWVGTSHEVRARVDMTRPVFLWPLLERDLHAVEDEFDSVWAEMSNSGLGSPRELIEAVVISAVLSGRTYWVLLALRWIEAMAGGEIQYSFTEIGSALHDAQGRAESQELSHKLRKVMRTLSGGAV